VARGQVTIELILILVIMLTVLASMSIPMVKDMADQSIDVGTALALSTSAQRIAQAADEVSYAGCGSFKNVTVYIEPDALARPCLYFNESRVWGEYDDMAGDTVSTKQLAYADDIKLHSFNGASDHVYTVRVEKDCSKQRHNPVKHGTPVADSKSASIGGDCKA